MAESQVTVNLLSTKEALELATKATPHVDVIKLDTPLIKSEGLVVITAVK